MGSPNEIIIPTLKINVNGSENDNWTRETIAANVAERLMFIIMGWFVGLLVVVVCLDVDSVLCFCSLAKEIRYERERERETVDESVWKREGTNYKIRQVRGTPAGLSVLPGITHRN